MNDSMKLNDPFKSDNPIIMSTQALLESARTVIAGSCDSKNDISTIAAKLLLKNFYNTSTDLLTVTAASSTTTTESMITKEVNDTHLNLTKILYEPDELDSDAKKDPALLNGSNNSMMDDDDRLVIDISDDEKREKRKRKATKGKMEDGNTKFSNQLPRSITYSLEPSSTGVSNSVKIDILASTAEVSSTTAMSKSVNSPTKHANITVADELNLLGHEIDRQMNKKANEVLELIKAYLSGTFNRSEFHGKMNDIGSVTMADLTAITKKVIKRYKFEANPNQHYFVRMKFLQFPTCAKDLVSYFEKLWPTLNRDKFINMIKFYEIIVKEMLNLNRTKILQYLIDFMIKRKNSQLDLLNFNYMISTGPIPEKTSPVNKMQMPDSTQQAPSEKKPLKFLDTSYNFVLRSDPIYIMACSKFQTIIRNVIRCRCSTCVQQTSFERRPFDNNILRNRRIGKRLVSEREDLMIREQQCHAIPEKIKRMTEIKPSKFHATTVVEPQRVQMSSPILVESDTPPPSENSSPPAIQPPPPMKLPQIEKAQIISQYYLQRAFSERIPTTSSASVQPTKPKFEFPKMTPESPSVDKQIRQPAKRRPSIRALDFQSKTIDVETSDSVQHITVNELKTLTENGTEIIPTSILKNSITSRRKTVDERAQLPKATAANIELRKVAPMPYVSEPLKPTPQSAHKALMKRRQSCHERILVPTTTQSGHENNLENNYLSFLKNFSQKDLEEQIRLRQMQYAQNQQNQHNQQQQQQQQVMYANVKRVRFSNEPETPQPRAPAIQYQAPTSQQNPQMSQRSPQFYQQQHQKFLYNRALRERGFYDRVGTLNDRENPQTTELVSHIPPERYALQQPNSMSPRVTRVPAEKSPRMLQRTSNNMNDEKMKLVAFQQLQSLRDASTLGPQQYAEHLKYLHQGPKPNSAFVPTSSLNYQRQNSQEPQSPREQNYYQNNTQSEVVTPSSVAPHSYHASASTTCTVTTASTSFPISSYEQNQSLQRKLKLKAKTLNYVEPNLMHKQFYNPPNSTYYSDPYAPSSNKQQPISTPTSPSALPQVTPPPNFQAPPSYQQSHKTLQQSPTPERAQAQVHVARNLMEMRYAPPQMQYHWMLHQHQQQQQQQHPQNHLIHPNQPARPIPLPRVQNMSAFTDPKISNAARQAYEQQQSEYYRQVYQQQQHLQNHPSPHHPKNL